MLGEALLDWYRENRRTLPWRGQSDPYRVWLSEIMLQQTRVEAVLAYYERFLTALPTVEALAAADEQTVLKLWEGLGYYSRARNLHKAAKMVAAAGAFPQTAEGLRALPGFGAYTAGAVASIAFCQRCAAVDGNVLRIHARVVCDATPLPSAAATAKAEAWVLNTLPEDGDAGDYNQALMDVGATICLPRSPKCEACPLKDYCRAYHEGKAEAYPVRRQKAAKAEEAFPVFLLTDGQGRVLVRRRAEKGLLQGLWEFPHHIDIEALGAPVARHRHTFTHKVWDMEAFCQAAPETLPEGCAFVDCKALLALPFPSAMTPFRDWFLEQASKEKAPLADRN